MSNGIGTQLLSGFNNALRNSAGERGENNAAQRALDTRANPEPRRAEHIEPLQPTDSSRVSFSQSSQFYQNLETSQSSDIQITTQEGDLVTISFQQQFSRTESNQSSASSSLSDTQLSAFSSQQSFSSTQFQSQISFSVEGDLNDDEQAALSNLFDDLGELTDQFFQGNTDAVFQLSNTLDFNSDELSGLSVNLQQNIQQTTFQANQYKQVAALSPSPQASTLNTPASEVEANNENIASTDTLEDSATSSTGGFPIIDYAQQKNNATNTLEQLFSNNSDNQSSSDLLNRLQSLLIEQRTPNLNANGDGNPLLLHDITAFNDQVDRLTQGLFG